MRSIENALRVEMTLVAARYDNGAGVRSFRRLRGSRGR